MATKSEAAKAEGNPARVAVFVFGHRAYAVAAEHLAISIAEHSPEVEVHVWAAEGMDLRSELFAAIHQLPDDAFAQGPGTMKTRIHDVLPEGDWLVMDADMLCLSDLTPWIERLKAHDFGMQVLGMGGESDSIAYMPWVSPATIREATKAPDDAVYYGVQSSWIWVRKGSGSAKRVFDAAKSISFTREQLKEPWGQDTPDEARFSAALTKTGIEPHSEPMAFYGNDNTYRGLAEASRHHALACLYGDMRQHRLVKSGWIAAYDRYVRKLCADRGILMRMSVQQIMDNKYVAKVKPIAA